jgi:hypothetical protein
MLLFGGRMQVRWLVCGFLSLGCPNSEKISGVSDTGEGSEQDTDADVDTDTDTDTETDTDTDTDTDSDTDTGQRDDTGEPEDTGDADSRPNAHSPLGMNLDAIRDWSEQWAFVDGFKHARAWIPQEVDGWVWDTEAELDLDPQGWVASLAPGQAAATLLFVALDGHYPSGEYVVLFDGVGSLEFDWDAVVLTEEPGRMTLDVNPSDAGIYIKLVETDAGDPLRNIRVIMPGFEESYLESPFHPTFVEGLSPFSVIRFMGWQNTNDDPAGDWDTRPTPDHMSQALGEGVAVEYMVELANTLHASPWFCMPHRMSNASVNDFAAYVRDNLDADLNVYVEYSNEVWNSSFVQATYAKEKGLDLGLADNEFQAQLRYSSQRSVEIFELWMSAWAGSDRVKTVLASQSANTWTGAEIMEWQGAYEHADALAIAPYFGGHLGAEETATEIGALTVDELFERLESDMPAIIEQIEFNADNAWINGLELIAYEGGQHLVGVGAATDDEALNALFASSNRDARMGEAYTAYLDAWRHRGGHLFTAFSYVGNWSQWGYWGSLEYQDQPVVEAPKYAALLQWIEDNPPWWLY